MQENIRFFALGGLDENGKNMFVLEIQDNIFVLDAGIKYPDRHTPGIDVIIPDYQYLIQNKSRVKAYIISHGHDDQMGALPYIYQQVPAPIYCSRATKCMIERKTSDYRLNTKIQYDFHLVKSGETVDICGRKFIFVEMTHAMPESFAIAIDTANGYIFYTSDFIVDYGAPMHHQMDLELLAQIAKKGVLLLLSESCDAEKAGHTSPKHRLTPYIQNLFTESIGRTFISLYSQNAFNQKEVIDLALKYNKKIFYINEEDFKLINELEYTSNPIPRENIVSLEDISRIREQDLIILITGAGEGLFQSLQEISNGIIRGRKIEFKDTDTFVLASPSVSGTEIISIQATDDIYKTGARIVNLTRKDIASMHAQEEDLKMMLALMKPKYYLPLKGEYKTLMANARIALNYSLGFNHNNIFVYDNGMILLLTDGKASTDFNNSIPTGDLLIDGNSINSINDVIIEERQKMACDGIIVLAVTISKEKKEIIAGPDIQMRGFIFLKDSENIVKQIQTLFLEQVKIYLSGYYTKKSELTEKICDKISRYVKKETGKNPLIFPNILDLD